MKVLQRYDLIDGKPGLKAAAMQADFMNVGGKIEIKERNEKACEMDFDFKGMKTTIRVTYDEFLKSGLAKSKKGGLKKNWARHPRQMLHARCVSEGINAVCPQVKVGMVTPEELMDMAPESEDKVDSILYAEEPQHVNGNDVEKVELPDEEKRLAKDSRKLRSAINKEMQPLTTEEDIRKVCKKYNGVHGKDFWQTFTYKNNEKFETFEDVAKQHIERITKNDERHTQDAHKEWINRVLNAGMVDFYSFLSAYNKDEKYQADTICFDALKTRAVELALWNDEELDFIPKEQIEGR